MGGPGKIESKTSSVETGVWLVVLGELCVFTLFFATFLYYRSLSPELFDASQAILRQDLGALMTILLLASSWCVASAVQQLNLGDRRRQVLIYLVSAMLCGAAFITIKIVEYVAANAEGVSVLTNDFFMFYFMLTGIHLVHLLVGLALLGGTTMHLNTVLKADGVVNSELVGFASCFWHMIDIVWIILFPLVYLLQ